MRIECNKQNLINAINTVSKAVTSRSTLDILSCILLIADRKGFRLIANDLKLSIETSEIESELYEKGAVALDARIFSEIIRKLPTDYVTIKVDEKYRCEISSGKSKFNINGNDPQQFPMPEELKNNSVSIEIGSFNFKNMIKKTIFSISTEENRPILRGEQIKFDEGYINIAAIDGCRVSWRRKKVDYNEYNEFVVPGKALNELCRLLPDDDGIPLKITFSSMHAMFELEQCKIVSRLLDGDFLSYENLFNSSSSLELTVNTSDLLNALERSIIVSDDTRKTDIKLTIKNNFINIISSSSMGKTEEDVPVNIEKGEEIVINFNARFLIDVMSACEEEYVKICFNTNKSPCIIKGVANNDYQYLVLPVNPRG